LRADGSQVVLVSKYADVAPEFAAELSSLGIEHFTPTDESFSTSALLQARKFKAAFLYLWFWESQGISTPQTYISAIREFTPSTKIVIVTDDAHAERHKRLNTVNDALSSKLPISNPEVSEVESAVYAAADVVVTATEADAVVLHKQGVRTPTFTLHFHHRITAGARTPMASFESRQGMVFVGYAKNPTNTVGLAWFCEKVLPLLDKDIATGPIRVVGANSDELVQSLSGRLPSDARVIAVPKVDDNSLATILSSSRVFIAPIFSTGLATKVLLGMSHGVPVVTTQLAANGYWCEFASSAEVEAAMQVATTPASFAQKLTEAYRSKEKWNQLSANGQALAVQFQSSEQFSSDVHKLLEHITVLTAKKSQAKKFHASFVRAADLDAHEMLLARKWRPMHDLPDQDWAGTGAFSGGGGTGMGESTGGMVVPGNCPTFSWPAFGEENFQCSSSGDPHVRSFYDDYFDCHVVGKQLLFEHVATGLRVSAGTVAAPNGYAATVHDSVYIEGTEGLCDIDSISVDANGVSLNGELKNDWDSFAQLDQELLYTGVSVSAIASNELLIKVSSSGTVISVSKWPADLFNVFITCPKRLLPAAAAGRGLCMGPSENTGTPISGSATGTWSGSVTEKQAEDACLILASKDSAGKINKDTPEFKNCVFDVEVCDNVEAAEASIDCATKHNAHLDLCDDQFYDDLLADLAKTLQTIQLCTDIQYSTDCFNRLQDGFRDRLSCWRDSPEIQAKWKAVLAAIAACRSPPSSGECATYTDTQIHSENKRCMSAGDPHVTNFNGDSYDCHAYGRVLLFEHIPTGLRVIGSQKQMNKWTTATVHDAVYVESTGCALDKIRVDATGFYVNDVAISVTATDQIQNGFLVKTEPDGHGKDQYRITLPNSGISIVAQPWYSYEKTYFNIYVSVPTGIITSDANWRGVCLDQSYCEGTVYDDGSQEPKGEPGQWSGNVTAADAALVCHPLAVNLETGNVDLTNPAYKACLFDAEQLDDAAAAHAMMDAIGWRQEVSTSATCEQSTQDTIALALATATEKCLNCRSIEECTAAINAYQEEIGGNLICLRTFSNVRSLYDNVLEQARKCEKASSTGQPPADGTLDDGAGSHFAPNSLTVATLAMLVLARFI